MKAKRKTGRKPRPYNAKVADKICGLLAEGKSLRKVCRKPGMPSYSQVMEWLRTTPEFESSYARADRERSAGYFELLAELQERTNEGNYNSMRVRIQALQWICARLNVKRFGDRLEVKAEVSDQRPSWDVGFSPGMTHEAKVEAFAKLGHMERMDRMRYLLFMMHEPAREISELWGIREANEAVDRMMEWLYPRMLQVCEGKAAQPIPEAPASTPRALAAPVKKEVPRSPLDNVQGT